MREILDDIRRGNLPPEDIPGFLLWMLGRWLWMLGRWLMALALVLLVGFLVLR